jgi:hypothetical protein
VNVLASRVELAGELAGAARIKAGRERRVRMMGKNEVYMVFVKESGESGMGCKKGIVLR